MDAPTHDGYPEPDERPVLTDPRAKRRYIAFGVAVGIVGTVAACVVARVLLVGALLLGLGAIRASSAAWEGPDDTVDYSYTRADVTDDLEVGPDGIGTVVGWPTGETSWTEDEYGRAEGGSFVLVTGKSGLTVNEVELEYTDSTRVDKHGDVVDAYEFFDEGDDERVRVTYRKTDGDFVAMKVEVIGGQSAPEWIWEYE